MKKIAFFDFDNTIYDGYTYQDFIEYTSKAIFQNDEYLIKARNKMMKTSHYNEKVLRIAEIIGEMIKGWSLEEFEKYCRISCNRSKISDWVVPVTDFLKLNGFNNIIISATFEEMLMDSLEALQIDQTFCSTFELVD